MWRQMCLFWLCTCGEQSCKTGSVQRVEQGEAVLRYSCTCTYNHVSGLKSFKKMHSKVTQSGLTVWQAAAWSGLKRSHLQRTLMCDLAPLKKKKNLINYFIGQVFVYFTLTLNCSRYYEHTVSTRVPSWRTLFCPHYFVLFSGLK